MDTFFVNLLSIFLLLALFSCSAYMSAAEMAFSSLSRARINTLAEGGGKRAKRAQLVASLYEEKFNEVLSTILICNNFIATVAATVSAALFARLSPEYGYIFSAMIIAVVLILFGDIMPKSYAKEAPEKFALFCAPSVYYLMTILYPINNAIVRLKKRLTKEEAEPEAAVAQTLLEQELIFMVEEAETDGIINEDDSTLITNAIEFNDVTVWDILTPRVKIASIPIGASVDEVAELFLDSGYSRMPVIEDSIDTIRGIVHIRDFLKCMATSHLEQPVSIEEIITPAVYTVTGAPITDVLTLLKKEKSHMAIVADEYGGTEGLVTMEDILEELVGEICDENDEVIEEFTSHGENKHTVLGTAAIDKMFEYFDMSAETESNTVGGWVMDVLRRVPEAGDSFEFGKLTVTVTKTDGRRAEECEIVVAADDGERAEGSEGDMPQDEDFI